MGIAEWPIAFGTRVLSPGSSWWRSYARLAPLSAPRAQTEAVDPAAIGIRTPAERMTERVGVPDNYRVPNAWRRRVAEDWAYDLDRRSALDPYEPHGAGEIIGTLDDSGRAAF